MKLYTINTGLFKLDGGAMFGVVPKKIWQKSYPADDNNFCTWALRCLLIILNDKKILIDTGLGNKLSDRLKKNFQPHGEDSLAKSLMEVGISFNEITDVVLTHLHFDHCGGCVDYADSENNLKVVFPNARHWISRSQWQTAITPNIREKTSMIQDNFKLLENEKLLNLIEGDTEIYPGIMLRLFFGHTNGQIIPVITHKNRKVIYSADLFPSVTHLPLVYIPSYDSRPEISMVERKNVLSNAVANDDILFFEHDYYNECCNLQQTEKGIRIKETFSLQEFCE